jgi:sulfatase modifying factor 1
MGTGVFSGGALAAVTIFAIVAPQPHPPMHEWHLLEGKYWQIASPNAEDVATTDTLEGTRGPCLPGMVTVSGRMKYGGWGYGDRVETLQDTTCVEWSKEGSPARCERFDRARWLAISQSLPTQPMGFCIDRYEYPDLRGANPWIMVTWVEAKALCGRSSKRLCTEAEWTFACEGEEALPYPYGYERNSEACVVDRPWRTVDAKALTPRDSSHAKTAIDTLWQGEESGSRPLCKSPFGVYDTVGNVDEWTKSSVAGERPSILKGGYWAPVRDRCRPATRAHGEDFSFYQQGFRCCADTPSAQVSSSVAPGPLREPANP